jgi:hypothetical protein
MPAVNSVNDWARSLSRTLGESKMKQLVATLADGTAQIHSARSQQCGHHHTVQRFLIREIRRCGRQATIRGLFIHNRGNRRFFYLLLEFFDSSTSLPADTIHGPVRYHRLYFGRDALRAHEKIQLYASPGQLLPGCQ